jgi:uncharacterized protein HemX
VSDNDSRDDGKVGAFLLGFLLGVVVCLGAGGALFLVQNERLGVAEAAARDVAEQAAQEAQAQRDIAEKAAREAKEAAEKPNN